ncbi:hypothetical protein B0H13DRAFT_2355482 [Mycena leptocephala]|nr:hypothetical protein B0H13DRAFT_2355482 [Mycena leptocephala]
MSTLQMMLLISDETGEITAYKDANVLGKFSAPKSQPQNRDVGTCVAVSAAQVQALGHWVQFSAATDAA